MTIDKIQHYMNPIIYKHWEQVQDTDIIQKAYDTLKQEIDSGILKGVQYHAELKLLKTKLG